MSLTILNGEHHKKMIKKSEENGTWNKLDEKLRYLHGYGGMHDPGLIKVELSYDHAGYYIAWLRRDKKGEYQYWMNGGLIFHKASKEWSVHT